MILQDEQQEKEDSFLSPPAGFGIKYSKEVVQSNKQSAFAAMDRRK